MNAIRNLMNYALGIMAFVIGMMELYLSYTPKPLTASATRACMAFLCTCVALLFWRTKPQK